MSFLVEWGAYNAIFVARVLPAMDKEQFMTPFAVLFNTTLGLALLSYLRARLSDPGVVPQRWHDFAGDVGNLLPVAPTRLGWQPGNATYCRECEAPRPERAHHCRTCGNCVLRMDHHCPWLNNCVGFKNHKYFLLAVGYALLACVVGIFTALPELGLAFDAALRAAEGRPLGRWWGEHLRDAYTLMTFGAIAFALAVALSSMFAAHVELCFCNTTSIEGHYDNMPNPFNQGSAVANVAQVFGEPGLDWLLPVPPRRPLTDGVAWERTDELVLDPQTKFWQLGPETSPEDVWRMRYRIGKDVEHGHFGLGAWLTGAVASPLFADRDQGGVLVCSPSARPRSL